MNQENLKRKSRVILLPTEKAKIMKYGSKLELGWEFTVNCAQSFQHLYFLSSDEIKANDYAYHKLDGKVILVTEDLLDGDIRRFGYSKVIASTDTSLGLPQPPQSFVDAYIKSYNEGNPIEWMNVDYVIIDDSYPEDFNRTEPKVDKHNCITVTRIKDTYTQQEVDELLDRNTAEITDLMLKKFNGYKSREEVILLLSTLNLCGSNPPTLHEKDFNTWIEQNL